MHDPTTLPAPARRDVRRAHPALWLDVVQGAIAQRMTPDRYDLAFAHEVSGGLAALSPADGGPTPITMRDLTRAANAYPATPKPMMTGPEVRAGIAVLEGSGLLGVDRPTGSARLFTLLLPVIEDDREPSNVVPLRRAQV